MGYLNPQRVCPTCLKKESVQVKRKSTNEFLKPPVQLSSTVLFSPPATPSVKEYTIEEFDDNSSEISVSASTLYYFDFEIVFQKIKYTGIQVSVSADRIYIVAADDPAPPFKNC